MSKPDLNVLLQAVMKDRRPTGKQHADLNELLQTLADVPDNTEPDDPNQMNALLQRLARND